ncbi:hypothetical protein HIM_08850 [Hirsutella minnesotensis 3608]|uniref:AB hydrolase-1 domain-containing protein n=1 Tax=Hirsutella minnesotensis 3608 TaxID=1043627 RepID=A0A0F7ZM71_9HYPO|nr:hypothetical protein HIM_08850 [Hirsutella minnesotensis 3608]
MSPSNLAVVICHGSYHTPKPYEALLVALRARGIESHCPQLPTADLTKLNVGDVHEPDFDRGPPEGGYPQGEQDVEAVMGVLEPLVTEQKKRVLIVGHSSGGWVATQAARSDLQAKARGLRGCEGGVVGIFYVGAFVIPVGESVSSFFQPKDGSFVTPPFVTFHASLPPQIQPLNQIISFANPGQKHGAAGLGTAVEAEKYFFNDLDADAARKWAATLTASPIPTTRLTNDAYAALPCAYLVLDGDQTLPKAYQEGMAAAQGAKTGAFHMYHCPAGHSPHLSWTEGMVDAMEDFASKVAVVD